MSRDKHVDDRARQLTERSRTNSSKGGEGARGAGLRRLFTSIVSEMTMLICFVDKEYQQAVEKTKVLHLRWASDMATACDVRTQQSQLFLCTVLNDVLFRSSKKWNPRV